MIKKIIFIFILAFFLYPISIQARTISCSDLVDMGKFKLTAYCPCEDCSEGHGYNTATETVAEEEKTIAVDPEVIDYGSKVLIGDTIYIAEDCGGKVKGDHIDIFMEDHSAVGKFGVKYTQIYIVRGEYEY